MTTLSLHTEILDCQGLGWNAIYGTTINDRYKIGSVFNKGSFGHIMAVTDTTNPELPLVIKIQKDITILAQEIQTLFKINNTVKKNQ